MQNLPKIISKIEKNTIQDVSRQRQTRFANIHYANTHLSIIDSDGTRVSENKKLQLPQSRVRKITSYTCVMLV